MKRNVYPARDPEAYRKAGPTDLVELVRGEGLNPLFLPKWIVEALVYGIVHGEFIHLSGPTGSAKSSLLESLKERPENFTGICESLGFPVKPLRLFPVEMAVFEAPGELYQRRALKDGSTFDEKSRLVKSLIAAAKKVKTVYPLVWLREIGRVHSSSVQGGLLNLMTKGDIVLPDGSRVDGRGIAWVADSNYQAEQDSTHTLVTLDDALKRRFTINLTLDYLTAEQEVGVLTHILEETGEIKDLPTPVDEDADGDIIVKVVKLGNAVRRQRAEGNLQTITPPTIYGYLACLRMARALPTLGLDQVAAATMLGNAGLEDKKHVSGVFNEVFGIRADDEDDAGMVLNLF